MSFLDSSFGAGLLSEALPGWTPQPLPEFPQQGAPPATAPGGLAAMMAPTMSSGGGGSMMPLGQPPMGPDMPPPSMSDGGGGAQMPLPAPPVDTSPVQSFEGAPSGASGPNPPPGAQFQGANPPMPTAAGQQPPYPPGPPVTVAPPGAPGGGATGAPQPTQPPNGPNPAPPPLVTGRTPVGPGGAAPAPGPGQDQGGPQGHWLNPLWKDPRKAAQMGGSLAAGLKAVANNWNKPGLAAFAGTAGSAMEGGQAGDDHFFNKTLQAKNEALKFHDAALKDQSEASREALAQSLIKFRQAQTEAIKNHGTIKTRNDDWRNSDLGRLTAADNIVQKRMETFRKSIDNENGLKSGDPVKVKAAQDALDVREKQERDAAYKAYGFTPEKADQVRKMGTPAYDKDGKIDINATQGQAFKPKTQLEYNTQVRVGDYFINTDGKLYKRTQPAPPPADAPGGVLSVGNEPGPQERELAGGEPAEATGGTIPAPPLHVDFPPGTPPEQRVLM